MIRIRKQEVVISGEKQLIIQIRDFTDSIQFEKIIVKLKQEKARTMLIQTELNSVFDMHTTIL
jgi:hypothetical protein